MADYTSYSSQIISSSTNLGGNYLVSSSGSGTLPNKSRDSADLSPIQSIIDQIINPTPPATRVYYDPIVTLSAGSKVYANVWQDTTVNRMFVDLVNHDISFGSSASATITQAAGGTLTVRLPTWLTPSLTQVRCIASVSPVGSNPYTGTYANSYIGWKNAISSTILTPSISGTQLSVTVPAFSSYCTLVFEPDDSSSDLGDSARFPWLSDVFDADSLGGMPDPDWIASSATWSVVASPQKVLRQTVSTAAWAHATVDLGVTQDYNFSTKVAFEGTTGRIGLLFNYIDANNCYVIELDQNARKFRLRRKQSGSFVTLASQSVSGSFDFSKPATVGINVTSLGGNDLQLTAMLNGGFGAQLLVTDSAFGGSLASIVGVQTISSTGYPCLVRFDDVIAESNSYSLLFRDFFETGSFNTTTWTTSGSGTWSVSDDFSSGSPDANRAFGQSSTAYGEVRAIATPVYNDDETVSSRINVQSTDGASASRDAGIILRYVDSDNYYLLALSESEGKVKIAKKYNGTWSSIGYASFSVATGQWYDIRASVNTPAGTSNATFSLMVDGVVVVTGTDTTNVISGGAVGLRTSHAEVDFDRFKAEQY